MLCNRINLADQDRGCRVIRDLQRGALPVADFNFFRFVVLYVAARRLGFLHKVTAIFQPFNDDHAGGIGLVIANLFAVQLCHQKLHACNRLIGAAAALLDNKTRIGLIFYFHNGLLAGSYLDRFGLLVPMVALQTFGFRYRIVTVLKIGNIDHTILVSLEIADFFAVQFTDGEYNIRQRCA